MNNLITEIDQETVNTQILAPLHDGYPHILTEGALEFLSALHLRFNDRRKQLLKDREIIQSQLNGGVLPDFRPDKNILDNPIG